MLEAIMMIAWVVIVVTGSVWVYRTESRGLANMGFSDAKFTGIYNAIIIGGASVFFSALTWFIFGKFEYALAVAAFVFAVGPIYFFFLDQFIETVALIVIYILVWIFFDSVTAIGVVGVLATVLIIYGYRTHCAGNRCPKCNKCVKYPFRKELISSQYKHETKSGKPDKRYKKNRLTTYYRYSYKCTNNNCANEFEVVSSNTFVEVRELKEGART